MSEKLLMELFHLNTTMKGRTFGNFVKFFKKFCKDEKYDVTDVMLFLAWEVYRMQVCVEGLIEEVMD